MSTPEGGQHMADPPESDLPESVEAVESVQAADASVTEATAEPAANDEAPVQETDLVVTQGDESGEAVESGEAAESAESAESVEELDPVEEMRAALRRAPGDWYVVHSYAGYENKVKTNLETRVQT
ncbi:MAG: transcription termination/antitermination protein NusG, partial [Mycobacteriaceae bacterium]